VKKKGTPSDIWIVQKKGTSWGIHKDTGKIRENARTVKGKAYVES